MSVGRHNTLSRNAEEEETEEEEEEEEEGFFWSGATVLSSEIRYPSFSIIS